MKVSKYCLGDKVLVDRDISTLCRRVWGDIYDAYEIYPENYPKCDKDWFEYILKLYK